MNVLPHHNLVSCILWKGLSEKFGPGSGPMYLLSLAFFKTIPYVFYPGLRLMLAMIERSEGSVNTWFMGKKNPAVILMFDNLTNIKNHYFSSWHRNEFKNCCYLHLLWLLKVCFLSALYSSF